MTRSSACSKSEPSSCSASLPAGRDRRLVADVGEVGAGQPGRSARDELEIDVERERLAAGVDGEDVLAPLQIGRLDEDLAVEAAGAQQRRVEVLEPVRGAHDDDLVAGTEAVELDEELVQRLVLLAVERVAAARPADRVELVDEDDRRARSCAPRRRACGCGQRRARRTSRRRPRRSGRRSAHPTRSRPPSPPGSCRSRAVRGAGSPSAPGRRDARTASGRGGSRRPPGAPPWPRRARPPPPR